MFRDTLIILASVAVVGWNIFLYRKRDVYRLTTKIVARAVLVAWVFTTLLPNFDMIISPITLPIKGKVADAQTGAPVPGCNIVASWKIQSITPAGGHTEIYHQYYTKADTNGEFLIPRYRKALGVMGFFPILSSGFGGVSIAAFTHHYFPENSGLGLAKEEQGMYKMNIKLKTANPKYVSNHIEGLITIFVSKKHNHKLVGSSYVDGIKDISYEDRGYILEELSLINNRLDELIINDKSKDIMIAMHDLATYYSTFGEINSAIKVLEKIGSEFKEERQSVEQRLKIIKQRPQ